MEYPDTITFERDGKDLVAVVGLPKPTIPSDAVQVEQDGVRYQILIAFGSVPGYPGVGFIARPLEA